MCWPGIEYLTRNSSGDEISEHDINDVRYVASLLIAHTTVANSSSPLSRGIEYLTENSLEDEIPECDINGVWGSVHGKGYFWGQIGACHCINQWGLTFAATWPSSQITLGSLVNFEFTK